jgi:tetratricopeptide (TPR) repeat protein
MDRRKILESAERLVRQGRLAQAAKEFQRLIDGDPGDLPILNKAGDLFARIGRNDEAVELFDRIAERYTDGGFFPKAIAIHKKILKLDPLRPATHVHLGDLYGNQDLLADARSHYLQAAESYAQAGDHESARDIWARLARLMPRDALARRKLAECHEALGEGAAAAEAWIQVTTASVAAESAGEALEAFRRAAKADPLANLAPLPLAELLGRAEQGEQLLAGAETEAPGEPGLALVRAELQRTAGDTAAAAETLRSASAGHPGHLALAMATLRLHLDADELDAARLALEEPYRSALAAERLQVMAMPLSVLCERLPEDVELVERLVEASRADGDAGRIGPALRRLAALKEKAGDQAGAQALLAEAASQSGAAARPSSATPAEPVAPAAPTAAADQAPAALAAVAPQPGSAASPAPAEAASAPPARGEDRDFLNEHLTEAEVFLKYGLMEKAIEQLRLVVERFPDHLEAREKLKLAYDKSGQGEQAAVEAEALARLRSPAPAAPPQPGTGAEIEIDLEDGGGDGAGDGDSFLDLAAELGEALAEEEAGVAARITSSEEPQSFEEVFSAFRETVAREVEDEDFDTHYDLGIAYKEMGLLDEAISEFQQACQSRDRFLDSCSMLAALFRAKGLLDQAEEWYRKGLSGEGFPEGHYMGLRYELAELCAEAGRVQEARDLYAQVFGLDANYRQVRERLAAIDAD